MFIAILSKFHVNNAKYYFILKNALKDYENTDHEVNKKGLYDEQETVVSQNDYKEDNEDDKQDDNDYPYNRDEYENIFQLRNSFFSQHGQSLFMTHDK